MYFINMGKKQLMLVSIPAVVIVILVIGISFNVPVSQSSTISPFYTGPVCFVEPLNSTDNYSIGIIDDLIIGLHPNQTKTVIYLKTSDLGNDSIGPEITSSGNIVLNDTEYSYDMVVQHSNFKNGNSTIDSLSLFNQTESYCSSGFPEHISIKTTIKTMYNISLDQNNQIIAKDSNSHSKYNIFKKVITDTVEAGPVFHQAISSVESNITSYSNFTLVKNGNLNMETFSVNNQLLNANGNLTTTDPDNSTIVLNATIIGEIHNGSENLTFTLTINNNSGRTIIGSDPLNFSLDPQSGSREINGGTQWVGEAKAVLPYSDFGLPSFLSLLVGLVGSIVGVFEEFPMVASAALAALAIVGFVLTNLLAFKTTSDTIDPYAELSYWHSNTWYLSWIPEIEFEIGAYSDRYSSLITGQTYTFSYSYNPLISDLSVTDTLNFKYPFPFQHRSIYPEWNPHL